MTEAWSRSPSAPRSWRSAFPAWRYSARYSVGVEGASAMNAPAWSSDRGSPSTAPLIASAALRSSSEAPSSGVSASRRCARRRRKEAPSSWDSLSTRIDRATEPTASGRSVSRTRPFPPLGRKSRASTRSSALSRISSQPGVFSSHRFAASTTTASSCSSLRGSASRRAMATKPAISVSGALASTQKPEG